ncbi:MAG: hypothetical protein Fur0022_47680 [Anaerolineales bacterium]
MSKELCKLKKSLRYDISEYLLLVTKPRFVCTNCGRVANEKKSVCSPQKISKALRKAGA